MIEDPILFWNAVALEVHRLDFSFSNEGEKAHKCQAYMDRQMISPEQGGPTKTSRALAIVHLAMNDAWVAYKRPGTPQGTRYLQNPILPDAEVDTDGGYAAVGEAAAMTLITLYPRQASFIRSKCQEWAALIAEIDASAIRRGAIFGTAVGKAILADRADDGAKNPGAYMVAGIPGAHQPDPYDPTQGFLGPAWGQVKPFSSAAPVLGEPPLGHAELANLLTDPKWHKQVEEVRTKGGEHGTPGLTRTAEETVIGTFWAYDSVRNIGTPPREFAIECRSTLLTEFGPPFS
jgi:hypothetical protein